MIYNLNVFLSSFIYVKYILDGRIKTKKYKKNKKYKKY